MFYIKLYSQIKAGKLCYIVEYYWNTDIRMDGIYMDIPIVEIANWINHEQ